MIGADLRVVGNLMTEGDLRVEGNVEGDIFARALTVGEEAHVKGEIRSSDVTVIGKVTGRIRGHKVRLRSTASVDGDIVHSSIAMEEGADFEGSIHRSQDPLQDETSKAKVTELNSGTEAETEQTG